MLSRSNATTFTGLSLGLILGLTLAPGCVLDPGASLPHCGQKLGRQTRALLPTTEDEPIVVEGGGLCTDTCRFAHDGECDDGGANADFGVCALGSDCGDCGPRTERDMQRGDDEPVALCTNDCPSAGDGECDDGGKGMTCGLCSYGSDCADCGPRFD